MRKVGIIGGLGPESTVDYYQSFIRAFQKKMDSIQTLPELFIDSINMYQIFGYISEHDLKGLSNYVGEAAKRLEKIGADFIVISANTPHIVFDQVQEYVQVQMISIVEATFDKAKELGLKRLGLFGTKFTMENDFSKSRFKTVILKFLFLKRKRKYTFIKKLWMNWKMGLSIKKQK